MGNPLVKIAEHKVSDDIKEQIEPLLEAIKTGDRTRVTEILNGSPSLLHLQIKGHQMEGQSEISKHRTLVHLAIEAHQFDVAQDSVNYNRDPISHQPLPNLLPLDLSVIAQGRAQDDVEISLLYTSRDLVSSYPRRRWPQEWHEAAQNIDGEDLAGQFG